MTEKKAGWNILPEVSEETQKKAADPWMDLSHYVARDPIPSFSEAYEVTTKNI